MPIAQSKTREQFPLSYKKIIKKTTVSMITYTTLLLIFLIFAALPGNPEQKTLFQTLIDSIGIFLLGFLVLSFIIFTLIYLYQRWYFAVYFYELTPDFIQIKKGPIAPREITIPYERIQDVYVDQDILDRIFGLYDVHLSSATFSSGMEAHIDGVEKDAAQGLRDTLLQIVKERISTKRSESTSNSTNSIF